MLAYTNIDYSSISEHKDNWHNIRVELWIGEFNYILNSDVQEVSGLIMDIVTNEEIDTEWIPYQ
jgi:hypothetical protein